MTQGSEHSDGGAEGGPQSLADDVRRLILGDKEVVSYVVDKATSQVTKDIVERENRRQRVWVVVGAILAGVGVAGIIAIIDGRVHNAVNADTTRDIIGVIAEKQIDQQREKWNREVHDLAEQLSENAGTLAQDKIDQEAEALRRELDVQSRYLELAYSAYSLDFKDSFSGHEKDVIVRNLISLSEEEDIRSRVGFRAIVEPIIVSLASADLLDDIEEIVKSYGDYLLESESIGPYLADTYGRHFLYAKRHDLDTAERLESVFRRLERFSEENDFQGAVKPWRMAIDVLATDAEEDKRKAVRRHVDELAFDTFQKAQALILLVTHQRSEWYQLHKDKTTLVVTEVFSEMFENYSDEIGRLVSGEDSLDVLQLVSGPIQAASDGEAFDWFMAWWSQALVQ